MADSEDEREVLTSLPRSRPTRRSSKRGERAAGASADQAPEDSSAPAKPARAKRAGSSARAKPAGSSARAKPGSSARAKRQPRQPTHDEPPAPTEQPPPAAAPERPQRPPERKVPAAGYAAPASGDQEGSLGATEILSTAIQAGVELAQIGFSVGRQVLRSALERLPKP